MKRRQGSGIGVVVAELLPLLRAAIGAAVEAADGLRLCAEVGDEPRLLVAARDPCCNVVLLDPLVCEHAVISVIRDMRCSVLLFTDRPGLAVGAVEAGAAGALARTVTAAELVDALQRVAAGETVLTASTRHELAQRLARPTSSTLTPREIEILTLTARGDSTAAVARELFLSESTVRTHLRHIYDKLGVHARSAAVATALRLGMISALDSVE